MPTAAARTTTEAGLLPRGLAYLADCAVVFVLFAATQLLLFTPLREAVGIGTEWFRSGLHTQLYVLATVSLPAWLYFALSEASTRQATFGKRLLGLKVGDAGSGARIGRLRSLGRTVVKLLPWEVAHLANNFPEPYWYVEEPTFRPAFAAVGLLMGLYMAAVAFTARRQGPHDLAARTVVLRSA